MNKLTKIAPIIVILAGAGSLFFVFKLDQKKKEHLNTIASLTSDLDSAKGTLRKTEANLRDTQNTLTNTTAELA